MIACDFYQHHKKVFERIFHSIALKLRRLNERQEGEHRSLKNNLRFQLYPADEQFSKHYYYQYYLHY